MRSSFYITPRKSSKLSPLAERYLRSKRKREQASKARQQRLKKPCSTVSAEVARQMMLAETPEEIELLEEIHCDEIAAWS